MAVEWYGVSAVYAGLLGLWWILLAVRVIRLRRAHRISLGDGGNRALEAAMRAHGNASESIPILMVLLLMVELSALPGWLVHLLGLTALTGRVLHGLHFFRRREGFGMRVAGMSLTFAAIAVSALAAIGNAVLWMGR